LRLWYGLCRKLNINFLETKLKLPSDVFIKRKKDKYLFLNPQIPDWIITNANGAAALKLCNGERTPGQVSSILSRIAQRNTSEEINNFFQEIISTTDFFSTSFNVMAKKSPTKTAPKKVIR
jgi:hypothetical protein